MVDTHSRGDDRKRSLVVRTIGNQDSRVRLELLNHLVQLHRYGPVAAWTDPDVAGQYGDFDLIIALRVLDQPVVVVQSPEDCIGV